MSGSRIFRSGKNSCKCACGRASFLVTALAGALQSSGNFLHEHWSNNLIEPGDPAY
jgi:hypothetical protein